MKITLSVFAMTFALLAGISKTSEVWIPVKGDIIYLAAELETWTGGLNLLKPETHKDIVIEACEPLTVVRYRVGKKLLVKDGNGYSLKLKGDWSELLFGDKSDCKEFAKKNFILGVSGNGGFKFILDKDYLEKVKKSLKNH